VAAGNVHVPVIRVLAILLIAVRVARAGSCPPAVALTGDDDAVRAVRDQLAARGITGETPSCPALRAQVERRGAQLVVRMVQAGQSGVPARRAEGGSEDGAEGRIERVIGEPQTAATVIESWVRGDVVSSLLEPRDVPPLDVAPPSASSEPSATGIQLFAAAETSLASDRTVWQGLQLGACIMLGPVCATARVRAAKVVARPDAWRRFKRKSGELLGGIDIPITVGGLRLRPGFSAGYGSMLTHHLGDDREAGIEMSGLRAEAHLGLSIPLSAHLAIDLVTAAELTQATAIETRGMPAAADSMVACPDEPRALFRLAVGIRYGAL